MSMQAASGHVQYGTMNQPHLSDRILERFSCESFFSELTTSNHLDELKRCGDTIRFKREPHAVVHQYEKNMKLKFDHMEHDYAVVQDSKGMYFAVKLDDVDEQQICESPRMIDAYTKSAMQQFKRAIEIDVLTTMMWGVDPMNQGCCAGFQSQCYNLGDCGAPLKIDCENMWTWLASLMAVHTEACIVAPGNGTSLCGPGGDGGGLFITLPYKAYPLLVMALSKGYCCPISDSTPTITGRIPEALHGFTLFFSHDVPYVKEGNETINQIVSGRRDATGFCVTMERTETTRPSQYFATFYKGIITWATGVIYPEALALSRVCFDTVTVPKG